MASPRDLRELSREGDVEHTLSPFRADPTGPIGPNMLYLAGLTGVLRVDRVTFRVLGSGSWAIFFLPALRCQLLSCCRWVEQVMPTAPGQTLHSGCRTDARFLGRHVGSEVRRLPQAPPNPPRFFFLRNCVSFHVRPTPGRLRVPDTASGWVCALQA